MRFSSSVLISTLLATAYALPAKQTKAAATAATGAGVLTAQPYADFQISDGVAGNALAEVNAKFPIDTTNLAGVAASDLTIINNARTTAEDAETDAFNSAVSAASGAAATALQNGKIKNKVLKLQLEVLGLQIEQAQTGKDNSADITAETTKLNTNIALDKKAAGQTSQSVVFTADDA